MNIYEWAKKHLDTSRDCILITGASSGIGAEYLRCLSHLGCTIYAISNELDEQERIATSIENESSGKIRPIYADFTTAEGYQTVAKIIDEQNIKILVNNAGIGMKGRYSSISSEDIDTIYAINVLTPLKILSHVLPKMLDNDSGVIIQVTTVNVISPIPLNALYTGGKTAVHSTFSAIMYENRNSNLLFHELLPGTTDTPFHDKQGVKPVSMVMSPQDVAEASLNNIDKKHFYPNISDRILAPIVSKLPQWIRMKITLSFLIKRLGLNENI